jgi:ribA/ribD-fused uncharacterized protein
MKLVTTPTSIENFREDYFFMSNMYVLENPVDTIYGIQVPTSEHAYQADRFTSFVAHEMVANTDDGIRAKNLARYLLKIGVEQRPDWDFIKVTRMHEINAQKYARNTEIAEKLIATGDKELVEGNVWDDRFWGVSPVGSRDGQNHLGRILMRLRYELQSDQLFEAA